MGYDRALWVAKMSIGCAVIAGCIWRLIVPGSWDYQAGQVTGAIITYIVLILNRPAASLSPKDTGGEDE